MGCFGGRRRPKAPAPRERAAAAAGLRRTHVAHRGERRLLLGRATERRGLDGAAPRRRLYHGEFPQLHAWQGTEREGLRNYCENPAPQRYPYLVELDDVEVFLDSENVGRVVVTERNTADWCASSDDYRPSQSPVTIAR